MLYGVTGNPGAGKSHTMVQLGLVEANRQKKYLIANFQLNLEALHDYCIKHKLYHVAALCRRGLIFYENDITRILTYENAVILADEMGIFANGNEFRTAAGWNNAKMFFFDLVQHRKGGLDMFWVSQHFEMVDINLRRITNRYYHVVGINNKQKFISEFNATNYENWMKARTAQKWLKEHNKWYFMKFDPQIFELYNTLDRIDDNTRRFDVAQLALDLGITGEPIALSKVGMANLVKLHAGRADNSEAPRSRSSAGGARSSTAHRKEEVIKPAGGSEAVFNPFV